VSILPLQVRPALLLLCLFVVPPAAAETLVGTVVHALDGDTVEVLDASRRTHRVRLAGIDAPESGQPFGTQAKRQLLALVGGEEVTVIWHKRDRYDRLVGKILFDGVDVNLGLIQAGMAWWYREYAGEQSAGDRRRYEAAEKVARAEGVGLWSDPRAVAPWDWRDGATTAAPAKPSSGACPCDSGRLCTGPRGGIYCVREGGSKQYFPRD
jgi:endonuclease YncB( thermonuclease family)